MGRPKKTEVTSTNLNNVLMSTIDGLRAGSVDVRTANAIATCGRGITANAKLNLDFAKFTKGKRQANRVAGFLQ